MEKILDRLDEALADGKYDADIKRAGLIWTAFSSHLVDELDKVQLDAHQFAKKYWSGAEDTVDHSAHFQALSRRMDHYLANDQDDCKEAIINRIVCASLMTSTGLTHEVGEFIVELAEKLGFSEEKIEKIFGEHIPEY